MEQLTEKSQVWTANVTKEDVENAIKYATISIPYTFDHMGYGGNSQNGVNFRIINIAKGIIGQSVLQRLLDEKEIPYEKDWTHYRDEDYFDFKICGKNFDVKTKQVYGELGDEWDREEFTIDLLMDNMDYSGPEWRRFFPLMLGTRQLSVIQDKDAFIYGIGHSHTDFRQTDPEREDDGFWITVPCKDAFHFFHNEQAIEKREEKGQGFTVHAKIEREQDSLGESHDQFELTLIGEWAGERQEETMSLPVGEEVASEHEFSGISSVRLHHPAWMMDSDKLRITAESNYDGKIRKTTDPSVNLDNDDFEWVLKHDDFVNLRFPDDLTIHWLGYITKEDYFEAFQKYPAYFIPKGDNMDENQEAIAISDTKKKFKKWDKRREKAIDNGDDIARPELTKLIDGEDINAGLMMCAYRGPRPIGAACYYYPPYALRQSALYILPQDLYTMDSLLELKE